MGVQALLIQRNSWQYLCDDGNGTIGVMYNIPCPPYAQVEGDFWAVPVKSDGIFTRLDFIIQDDAPTFDSFQVFRITDKLTFAKYWVRGTVAQYEALCEDCCGNIEGTPLPTDVPTIAPCQEFCNIINDDGEYQTMWGLPSLAAGQTYHPYGSYNNVEFTPAPSGGYASTGTLLTFLNANWNSGGSPVATIVWTVSGDGLTLIATGGNQYDSICVVIHSVYTSP